MTISEAIDQLRAAKRQLGDVDLVYVINSQCEDIEAIEPHREAPLHSMEWDWCGPVAIVLLGKP